MKISEAQKQEIERLANQHPEFVEALIGFGGDMYRQGIWAGAITVTAGYLLGRSLEYAYNKYKNHKCKVESD